MEASTFLFLLNTPFFLFLILPRIRTEGLAYFDRAWGGLIFFGLVILSHVAAGGQVRALTGLCYMFAVFEMTRVFVSTFGASQILKVWFFASALAIDLILITLLLFCFNIHVPYFLEIYETFPYFGYFPRATGPFEDTTSMCAYFAVGILLFHVIRNQNTSEWNKSFDRPLFLLHNILAIALGILVLGKHMLLVLGGLLVFQGRRLYYVLASVLVLISLTFPLGVFLKAAPEEEKPQFFVQLEDQQVIQGSVLGYDFYWVPTNYTISKYASLKMFQEVPLFGVGHLQYINKGKEMVRQKQLPASFWGFAPHSSYLGLLAQSGLFGFLGLFALMFFTWKSLKYHVECQVNTSFISMLKILAVVWLIMGIHSDLFLFPAFWFTLGLINANSHWKNHERIPV